MYFCILIHYSTINRYLVFAVFLVLVQWHCKNSSYFATCIIFFYTTISNAYNTFFYICYHIYMCYLIAVFLIYYIRSIVIDCRALLSKIASCNIMNLSNKLFCKQKHTFHFFCVWNYLMPLCVFLCSNDLLLLVYNLFVTVTFSVINK